MEKWLHTTLTVEAIALDTCKQLVAQGRTFICERVAQGDGKWGWLFMVRIDNA
jgi:hypothetical protein